MIKKVFLRIGFMILIFHISACFAPEHYKVKEINFKAKGNINPNGYTIIPNNLIFIVKPQYEYLGRWRACTPSVATKCYAIYISSVADNEIDTNSFILKFDKTFTFQNEAIQADSDLFTIAPIRKQIRITDDKRNYGDDDIYYQIEITFNNDFIEKTNLSGMYTASFACSTSDNEKFYAQTPIYFSRPLTN